MFGTEKRIRNVSLMTIRKAEIHIFVGRMIKLIGWNIIPQIITSIVREPHLFSLWVPRKPDSIAYAGRIDLHLIAIGLHAQNGFMPLTWRLTNIARRAHRNI